MLLLLNKLYARFVLLLLLLKCSEIQIKLLENHHLHHGKLQVMNDRLIVSHSSGRNYQALLIICGHIDTLEWNSDSYGDCRRWTTHVYKRASKTLFIQIFEIRRIKNPLKFDSGKHRRSHGTSTHVG